MKLGPFRTWCSQHVRRLAGLAIGLAFVGWGVMNCLDGLGPPQPYPISAAELEHGKPLPGKWLSITGRLLSDERIIWPGPETRETFVPLVSPSWQKLRPVAVFVRAREDDWGQPGRLLHHTEPSVIGMADHSEMDPELVEYFTKFEMPPRDDAIILEFEGGPNPQSLILGYIGLGIGGVVLLITGLVWLVMWHRAAPAASPESSHE
jgi:hypothetical protein